MEQLKNEHNASTYHGALYGQKIVMDLEVYLTHLARIDMGGNEGVHKLSPTKEYLLEIT